MRRRWKDGDKWLGGYVRVRGAVTVFVIERRLAGKRWHFSTRCNTETAALKTLERFQADPHGFARLHIGSGVVMTAELIARFVAWQRSGPDAVTQRHAHYVGRYLADWLQHFGSRDLRSLTLPELKRWLVEHRGSHGQRIAALKAFFAWLREEEGVLRHSEDVTLDWPVPQAVPAQRRRQKALSVEQVTRVVALLNDDDRDAVALLMGTGWHLTEVARFAKGGEILPGQRNGELATLVVLHKNGAREPTALTQQGYVDAARRIRERGIFAHDGFSKRFGNASEAAGLPRITAGVFRHSVATWAVQAGADVLSVSRFLHHKDPRTTARFYVSMGLAPEAVPTVTHLAFLPEPHPPPVPEPDAPPSLPEGRDE